MNHAHSDGPTVGDNIIIFKKSLIIITINIWTIPIRQQLLILYLYPYRIMSKCMHTLHLFAKFLSIYTALSLVFGHWVDPDTNPSHLSTVSLVDGTEYKIIFSDEFNVADRKFHDGTVVQTLSELNAKIFLCSLGADPRWTAINKNDYTNYALHYYNESLVSTSNGFLKISTINEKVFYKVPNAEKPIESKVFQSAMIQGWNKFCFTGI